MLWIFVCVLVTAFQVGYWVLIDRGFRRAGRNSDHVLSGAPGVSPSVVVAARNEAGEVGALMQALARQSLPPRDVVLVDDGSTDETVAAATSAAPADLPLRIVQIRDDGGSKKRALTEGMARAGAGVVSLTDADCTPRPEWLASVSRAHAARNGRPLLLVGYSPYRRARGFLNRLARYETFVAGTLTAAGIGLGHAYMAVGRNLSYERATFHSIGGFAHSAQIRSGDDDLLVQHVLRTGAAEVVALLDARTFVDTDAPRTWREWLHQKRRHVAASRYYDRKAAFHLGLLQTTALLSWGLPFVAGWAGAAFLGVRLAVQFGALRRAARRLDEPDLIPLFVPLELLYAAYNLIVVPLALVRPPRRW